MSVNESTSVPTKKKAKVDSSQAQSKHAKEAKNTGSGSLQSLSRKQSSSTGSKQKKANRELLVKSGVKQEIVEEVKQENSLKDKNKSPFKSTYEITPQNPVVSPRKEKLVKKKLDLDPAQGIAKPCAIKQEAENSLSEDSDSDNEGIAWEDVDGRYLLEFIKELKQRHFLMVDFSLKL